MHSLKLLEEKLREQNATIAALENALADADNVTLRLGDEFRESVEEVTDRLDHKPRVHVSHRAIRI